MGYFSAACMATGALTWGLRNSKLAFMNPWALLFLSVGSMIGTQVVSYEKDWLLKNACFAGFITTMSLSMVPLIHMYAMPVIYDALLATGVTVGSLGFVAYNAPSE